MMKQTGNSIQKGKADDESPCDSETFGGIGLVSPLSPRVTEILDALNTMMLMGRVSIAPTLVRMVAAANIHL